ncbi:MAG: hypothetical protein DWQ05_10930 [Calditrichaeota bacterium]|nr:MAG: hypothetical protein DWQ05_10930 [Calditrichota bacterium]
MQMLNIKKHCQKLIKNRVHLEMSFWKNLFDIYFCLSSILFGYSEFQIVPYRKIILSDMKILKSNLRKLEV